MSAARLRAIGVAVGLLMTVSASAAGLAASPAPWPDSFVARLEALALIESLNADLLGLFQRARSGRQTNQIVAGHGRYEAALVLGLETIPVITLDHPTEAQARGYLLADNKLAERSSWDDASLAVRARDPAPFQADETESGRDRRAGCAFSLIVCGRRDADSAKRTQFA